MKKMQYRLLAIGLITAICTSVFFSGCQNDKPSAGHITDYIQARPDTVYYYEGSGHPEATWQTYVDYIHEDGAIVQDRVVTEYSTIGECISIKNGEMRVYFSDQQFQYFYDMTDQEGGLQSLILQEPLELGHKWERIRQEMLDVDAEGQDIPALDAQGNPLVSIATAEITAIDKEITVPYGTVKAMEVTVTMTELDEVIKEYYAKGIGLVKNTRTGKDPASGQSWEISSQLSSIEEGGHYVNDEYFFYPMENSEGTGIEISADIRPITYQTGQDVIALLQRELKNPISPSGRGLIGDNVTIRSIEYDRTQGRVRVDFSSELPKEMNAGVGYEEAILQSLVNSLGYYFNSMFVCINVEGEGYESGHILYGKDEYLPIVATVPVEEE